MYLIDEKKTIYRESEMKINNPGSEIEKDSRFTVIGRFLIMSGLDQLPQLFNVLKGEIPIIAQKHPLQSEALNDPQRT
jgi:lipopolysaccharide/colanic/teichoic acid biosynthesis glycosyltransferase